jgi:hypothetical protein
MSFGYSVVYQCMFGANRLGPTLLTGIFTLQHYSIVDAEVTDEHFKRLEINIR